MWLMKRIEHGSSVSLRPPLLLKSTYLGASSSLEVDAREWKASRTLSESWSPGVDCKLNMK